MSFVDQAREPEPQAPQHQAPQQQDAAQAPSEYGEVGGAPAVDLHGEESSRLAKYWQGQVDLVRDEYKKWSRRGRKIEQRYRNDRARADSYADEGGTKRYASLWSNVQTLLPTLYGRAPTPIVERRFRDRDPVGRGAATILERSLRNEVEINGLHEAVEQCVLDYLLPGRGSAWVRYEPEFGPGVSLPAERDMDMRDTQGEIEPDGYEEDATEQKLADTGDRVVRESVPVDYVYWDDLFLFPAKARTWKQVVAVGKRVYPTRDQMRRRFGKKIGDKIPLQDEHRDRRGNRYDQNQQSGMPGDPSNQTGEVYEIWSRTDERVYWVAEDYPYLADCRDDPLELEGFFPIPRPLFANPTNGTLVPVADYIQYQDQAVQIDELTQRVSMLAKACKVAGCYDASQKSLARLLDEAVELQLIPVDNWAVFGKDGGGVPGKLSFLPLKEIIGTINELSTQLDRTTAQMDRLTGITDVLRGTGDARETVGGQRIKSNAGGTRMSKRQVRVAEFARDLVKMVADVMCRHFSARSLVEASGAVYDEALVPQHDFDSSSQSPQQIPQGDASPLMIAQNQLPAGPPAGEAAPPGNQPPQPLPGGGLPPQPTQSLPQPGAQVIPFPRPAPPPVDPDQQRAAEAAERLLKSVALLRNDRLRGFRVDIETDSTIFGDAQQEKQDRNEFIGAMTKFLEAAVPLGQGNPKLVPLLGKMLQFGVRGYHVGRDLESTVDEVTDELARDAEQAAKNPQQYPPSPEMIKAQSAQQSAQLRAQSDQQRSQLDLAKGQQQMQQLQLKTRSDQVKAQAEVQRQELENQGEEFNSRADLAAKQADERMAAMDREMMELKLQLKERELEAMRQRASAPLGEGKEG